MSGAGAEGTESGRVPGRSAAAERAIPLAAFGFALVSLTLFVGFVFGAPGRIASHAVGDGARYFVFMRSFYAEQLLAGNIPLWNPHIFSGLPFVGAFQSAVFYPPNALYLVFPVDTALDLDFALHLFALQLFTFLWLLRRGLHPLAAGFAALMTGLSAPNFLRVLAGQLSVLNTLAWSPLLFLAVDALARRASMRAIATGVLAATMMLLAGHPPTAYMAAFVAALYCALAFTGAARRPGFVLSLAAVAILPLLLAAVQVATGLDVGREGIRSGGTAYAFSTSFSLPPENLMTLLAPRALGDAARFKQSYWGRWFYWDASAYVGLVGLVLALHGARRGEGSLRRAALVIVPLALLLALGQYTPLYRIAWAIVPGFDQFRSPSKFLFFAAVFAAVLAGLGVDRLLREGVRSRLALAMAGAIAVLLGAFALFAWMHPPSVDASPVAWLSRLNEKRVFMSGELAAWQTVFLTSLAGSAALFGAAALLLALGRRRRWALLVLVALGALELLRFAYAERGGTWTTAEYARRPMLAETYRRAGPDRVLLAGRTSDLAMNEGGYEIWGYDPVVLLRYAEFIAYTQGRRVEDLDNVGGQPPDTFHPLYAMLRGRYRVGRSGEVEEQPDPAPRFWLVRDHRIVANRSMVLPAITSRDFDPRVSVVLESVPRPAPTRGGEGGQGGVVRLVDESTDHMTLEVEADTAAILVIGDAYAEGWRTVALPGSSQRSYQLLPANYVLRAVPLAAGVHRLRVEYSPLAWRVGAWTSAATLALVLGAGAGAVTRRMRVRGAGRAAGPGSRSSPAR